MSLEYDGDDADLKAAMLRQAEAETDRIKAEAEHFRQQARRESEAANQYALITKSRQRDEDTFNALDACNHVYRFNDHVDSDSVYVCTTRLTQWRRLDPGKPIEIIFNSPGGSVWSGMELFDTIRDIRAEGHRVTTTALGMAASMAAILHQAGDVRVMGSNAVLLIHRPSTMAFGEIGQIEDTVKMLDLVCERVVRIFIDNAKDAAHRGTASDPISEETFRRNWERKDWTLNAEDALKLGIVDVVR